MVSGYAPAQEVSAVVFTQPGARHWTGRTQLVLLTLIRAVRNVCDEHDVQCLAFLAAELGLLRQSPFCFSRKLSGESPFPESLVLRDTFETMVERQLIGWDGDCLQCFIDEQPNDRQQFTMREGVSWLGALVPSERHVFTRATIDLHASGANLLSSAIDLPFRRTVTRILGDAEGADVSERRLSMVRRQLGIA